MRMCIWLLSAASTLAAVQYPPSLIQGPRATTEYITDNAGDKVTLNCTATGSPTLERQWLRDDEVLPRTDEVLHVRGDDVDALEGYYQCRVQNTWGTVVSNKTLIRVAREGSKRDYDHPFHYDANVGMKLTLPCKVEDHGIPSPTVDDISWTRDGVDIDQDERLHFTETAQLLFSAVSRNDFDKKFRCKIKNSYIDVDVKSSTDSIVRHNPNLPEVAPTSPSIMYFTNQSFNSDAAQSIVVGIETRNVSLRCIFAGSEDIEIDWRLPPGVSVSRRKKDLHGSRLTLYHLRRSDAGDYICVGVNSYDRTEFKFQLVMYAAPRFESIENQPHDVNANVGDNINIRCLTYANPPATVQWFQNGKPLDPDNPTSNKFIWSDDRLTMTVVDACKNNCTSSGSVSTSDLMVVQCNASNEHGYIFANGYINVFERTRFVVPPLDVAAEFPHAATFYARAVSDADTPVSYTWYHNGHRLVSDAHVYVDTVSGNLTILETDEDDLGEYKCVASNGISTDTATAKLHLPGEIVVVEAHMWPLWWLPIVLIFILLLVLAIVLFVSCSLYRNRGEHYEVDETERKCGNDPERDLCDEDFKPFRRPDEASTQSLNRSLAGSSRTSESDTLDLARRRRGSNDVVDASAN